MQLGNKHLRITAILFIVFAVGCRSALTLPPAIEPTSPGSCFPASVFTAADMHARVDCHPDEYKLKVTDDTVVLFAFPDPIIDWVGPVFVIHIPSVSETVLNMNGSVLFEDYKTTAGEHAIKDVLANQELLNTILAQAKEIEGKSQP